MATRKPTIERLVHATGRRQGRAVSRARPADVVVVEGSGFGRRADRCVVLFDDVEVTPHDVGYSPDSFVVSVPLPPRSTDTVRVRIGDRVSEPIDCRLVRPRRPRRPAGSEIRALYGELDQLATLTAAAAVHLAPRTAFEPEIRQAAVLIDGYRGSMQHVMETLGQFAELQEAFDPPENMEAIRSIRLLDDHLRAVDAVDQIAAMRELLYGRGGRFEATVAGSDVGIEDVVLGRADEGPPPSEAGDAVVLFGFTLHEVTKALEGIEDLFDLAQPSIQGAVLDLTIDLGGIPSAFAKALDLFGQYLFRGIEDESIQRIRLIDLKIDRLEGKLDRLDGKVDGLDGKVDGLVQVVNRIDENVRVIGGQIGDLTVLVQGLVNGQARLEEKADRTERALEIIEGKEDRAAVERSTILELIGILEGKSDAIGIQLGRQEEKLDRLELKGDRAESKLDALEAKGDRAESKLDALEAKGDRAETKLDTLDGKADRAEAKLDRLEAKGDRAEGKLDALEMKADRAETKLDRLDGKADRAEAKLDRIEPRVNDANDKLDRIEPRVNDANDKLDRIEPRVNDANDKLDRIEPRVNDANDKLDRIEPRVEDANDKLDILEAKADRAEEKLDRQEVKLDLLDRPAPLEGSVAAQRGGGRNVTATVTATDGTDNSVNVRAAIDVPPDRLDDDAAWSPWIDFGRPAAAAGILETSIDLAYVDRSNDQLSALLSARDEAGRVFHRALEAGPDDAVIDPAQWSDWQDFLQQP